MKDSAITFPCFKDPHTLFRMLLKQDPADEKEYTKETYLRRSQSKGSNPEERQKEVSIMVAMQELNRRSPIFYNGMN